MKAIPWTYDPRPDTRTTNVRVGVWLFLASEAMFFGSLFSAYVLLRTGAANWPDASTFLDLPLALVNTALLVVASGLIASGPPPKLHAPADSGDLTGGGLAHRISEGPVFSRGKLYLAAALGVAFLAVKAFDYRSQLDAGLHPATNTLLACWFALTAVHALHVAGGVGVNLWLAIRLERMAPAQAMERLYAARLYWFFVDTVWIVILIAFYTS